MKEQSIRYKNLISCAKTFEYYASILEEPRKQYWIEQANNKRLEPDIVTGKQIGRAHV